MAAANLIDFSKLCIHTITTKPLKIYQAVEEYRKAGIAGITLWKEAYDHIGATEAKRLVDDNGLSLVSLCRGGFFPSVSKKERKQSIEDNLRLIDEAAALGSPLIVLVCGASPLQPLEESRNQIKEGISAILPHAKKSGIRLAIEPLHPMYADTRSAINTMRQANDICDELDSAFLGVAVDVYHIWWDNEVEEQLSRCGKRDRIFAFHISDWKSPTEDLLNDRGLMGEGCIRIRQIRSWVEESGFSGFNEVEIFSNKYWKMNQKTFIRRIKEAYLKYV